MGPFKGEAMKDLTSLQERMNRIFTESLKRIKEMAEPDDEKPWSPPVDVFELEDSFVILADVPGIPKENITIEVESDTMIIRGDRPREQSTAGGSLFRSERYYGPFERTFNLPINLATGNIQAKVASGVLTITINKPEPDTRRVKVDIE